MQISNSLQQSWHVIGSILQNYILNTATPLIFTDLFNNYRVFNNDVCKDVFISERTAYEAAINNNSNPPKPKYINLIKEVWENLLKEGLVNVFIQRLLGTQTDMETYIQRSDKYVQTFNEIIGTDGMYNDMKVIKQKIIDMLKDYLCRNVPELQETGDQLSMVQVLEATRFSYNKRRKRIDKYKNEVDRDFYLPFEEQSYASSLLLQMDEIVKNEILLVKCNHFLVCAEYIHTLFIYVYIVEYIKNYPTCKGDRYQKLSPEKEQGKNYNVFTHLKHVDFASAYNLEKARLAKRNCEH